MINVGDAAIENMLFCIVGTIGAITMLTIIFTIFAREIYAAFPEKASHLPKDFNEPIYRFNSWLVSCGWVCFRGASADVTIYEDKIVIKALWRALVLTNFDNIEFKKSVMFGYSMYVKSNNRILHIALHQRNYDVINTFIKLKKEKSNV